VTTSLALLLTRTDSNFPSVWKEEGTEAHGGRFPCADGGVDAVEEEQEEEDDAAEEGAGGGAEEAGSEDNCTFGCVGKSNLNRAAQDLTTSKSNTC